MVKQSKVVEIVIGNLDSKESKDNLTPWFAKLKKN